MSFPPIPPFPTLPFGLPFNLQIPEGHNLKLPPDKDSCSCCVKKFLDCLITASVVWHGCNWSIQVNKKVYLILWRDVLPRGPATRQVWDIFRVDPPHCNCPSTPVSLGWQWCWDTVIQTIWSDVKSHWVGDDLHGGGHTYLLTGTDLFSPGSVFPQPGPILHLDADQTDSLVLSGASVEAWRDLSTKENHALQQDPLFQPSYDPASLNGKGTISFNGASFLSILLKKVPSWHIFIVGKFLAAAGQGTFFSATGAVAPYSGILAKIFQDGAGAFPIGSVASYIHPSEVALQVSQAAPNTFGIFEWSEDSTKMILGLNAFSQTVRDADLSPTVVWDPLTQLGGSQPPLLAFIGRSTWGLEGMPWDYLSGSVAEILVYPGPLSGGRRIQIHNVLREKWNLGAPLPLPGV